MEEMKQILKELVAQRLSAAPDSTAKAELIEELSGNLYCRYTDLTGAGVEPEEAKAQALDALGDTNELVEYLKGLEPNQPLPELVLDPAKEDGGQIEEILHNVEGIIKGAFHKAKSAIQNARDTVREEQNGRSGRTCSEAERKVAEAKQKRKAAERDMNEAEQAMNRKEAELDAAREALEELENARETLEKVSDQSSVAQALAAIMEKIGAKQAEVETLEEEYEALEETFDALEEEFDELEDVLEDLEDELAAEEDELAAEEDELAAEEDELAAEEDELAAEEDELAAEEDEDEDEDEDFGKGWKVTYEKRGHATVEIDSEELKTSVKNMMKDIEQAIREATGVAKDAFKSAAEATGKFCDDVSASCTPDTAVEADQPIDAQELHAIDVQICNGDITVRMSQPADGDVLVGGDTDDFKVFRSADGVLTIRPIRTETSAFFSGRGVFSSGSSTDVVLELPCRSWKNLRLVSTNGDIRLEGACPVDAVSITSVSGDVNSVLPSCGKVACKTTNGDVHWTGDVSELKLESVSGNLRFCGLSDKVMVKSTCGDVDLEGGICSATLRSISGDLWLRSSVLPDWVDAGSTSGDLRMDIPDAGSFTAKFRSTGGDFTSDFFTGKMGGRNCVFHYQGGGERTYSFVSTSGDVEIRKYRK